MGRKDAGQHAPEDPIPAPGENGAVVEPEKQPAAGGEAGGEPAQGEGAQDSH